MICAECSCSAPAEFSLGHHDNVSFPLCSSVSWDAENWRCYFSVIMNKMRGFNLLMSTSDIFQTDSKNDSSLPIFLARRNAFSHKNVAREKL